MAVDLERRPRSSPRRGLSSQEAAVYVGVSQTKFLELVSENRMPRPVRVDRRSIWDIHELDNAFDSLKEAEARAMEPIPNGNGWGNEII